MYKNIHYVIKSEYEKKQKMSFDRMLQRMNEVYSNIPRVAQIDNEIRLTGIKHNKMILLGTATSDNALMELVGALENLKREKELLLGKHSYPLDYLEQQFECEQCQDTGFVDTPSGTVKCCCYRQQYINCLFKQSNLKIIDQENFSTFDENLYPDDINENKYEIKISPRDNILKIRERSQNFIDNIDIPTQKNLFFSGPTGVGKTFMINCIASELLQNGRTVLYQTAPSLFKAIYEYRQKNYKNEGYEDMSYDNIFNVDVLIIDDLGTESPTAARYAELLSIINTRQENNLSRACKTIISTNLGITKLHEFYDERIASRIIGGFDLFRFAGKDIRMLR